MPLLTKKLIQSAKPNPTPYEIRDSRVKGLLIRVQPSGCVSYVVEWRRGRRTTIGRTTVFSPDEARDRAKKVLGEAADGLDPLKIRNLAKTATLAKFLKTEYGPWFEANRKSGKPILKRLKHCFQNDFGSTRLHEISPLRIDKWRGKKLAEGLSKNTLNRDLSSLKAALSKAVEWGFIEKNPISKAKLYSIDDNASVRFLLPDEENRLRVALRGRDEHLRKRRSRFNDWRRDRDLKPFPEFGPDDFADHLHPIVLLALNTGMRRGEIFNLRWSSVDFDKALLEVAGPGAKSGQTRHVPLNHEAIGALNRWNKGTSANAGLVFPGNGGGRLTNINRAWESVMKRAGLENFRFHDCRHHFASGLVMADVPLNTVRELLGHSEISMTLRYAHLALDHKADAVAKLNRKPDAQPNAP
jgi:integrase